MTVALLAAGIFETVAEAATGMIIATAERTVTFPRVQALAPIGISIPFGAGVWAQAYDPGDLLPYALDFTSLLDDDEKIAAIAAITMPAAAAALGVQINQAAGYAPVIDVETGKRAQVWFTVDTAHQADAPFDGTGAQLPVAMRITTDSTPPKRIERTAVLVVRQQ